MSFKVRQKVTCINASNFDARYGESLPVLGGRYTVRSLYNDCIRLKEIINMPHQYQGGFMECSFKSSRFVATTKGRR